MEFVQVEEVNHLMQIMAPERVAEPFAELLARHPMGSGGERFRSADPNHP
jgi:hypothetical protein